MTGARTPVELYRALLPVYCRVMLLQPSVAQDKGVLSEVGVTRSVHKDSWVLLTLDG